MTLLEEIISGASADAMPVATLLRKVKVLAARIKTVQLAEWVEHELVGYPAGAKLSEYRGPFPAEVLGNFSGPLGLGLRNAPIPSMNFPVEYRSGTLFNIQFQHPIAEIEQLSLTGEPLQWPWAANAILVTNYLLQRGEVVLYEDMGLQTAWRSVSPNQLRAIVDTVRTRVLDLALSLESVAPDAGQQGASIPDPAAVQPIVMNMYGGAANIAVQSSAFEQSITRPEPGDRAALFDILSHLGVEPGELEELESALDADETSDSVASLGPATSRWLGRVVARIASAGVDAMSGAGGALIAQAIMAYLAGPRPH